MAILARNALFVGGGIFKLTEGFFQSETVHQINVVASPTKPGSIELKQALDFAMDLTAGFIIINL